ncbi:sensor histidine kinase [Kribbella sp. CA-293567]|uniref:sensor histidine kinase n=1 Tax=Kribbella sp. CA-293567 TaxID=3002436 RepID=UPI0022DDFBE8|nr:sensor histidine kinase [Kribbella sp. CA-293567]WBQ07470.1 sensor histidine kinase [Kribbella sp. CA-293567]
MLIDSASDATDGDPAGFSHDAFVYADDDEFVGRAAPFLRDGLIAGEVAAAALPPARIALLRTELGELAEQVTFIDITAAGRNPARIIGLWTTLLSDHPGRPVRGLGEPAYPGRSEAEFAEARLHESLLNVAFQHSGPFRLRCPYSATVLSADVDPATSHPAADSSTADSQDWSEVARGVFGTPLPVVPAGAELRDFGRAQLSAVRRWAGERALQAGLSAERTDDLTLALHEVCTNSIRFGGGRGRLSLWTQDRALILDIADQGRIDDLLVGRMPPPIDGLGGRGVWMANQLCDLVQLRSGPTGTQIRLHTRLD